MHPAAQKQRMFARCKMRCPVPDLGLASQHMGERRRQMAQLLEQLVFARNAQAPALLGQYQRQDKQRGELGGEGLGRRNADFRSRAGQETQLGLPNQRAFGHVTD